MKFSVGAKISLLMVFAVITVIATGYLSYKSLSSIVNSIDVETRPDLKLEHIRVISSELDRAENNFRTYLLTHNNRALKKYFAIINSIDVMLDSLKSESRPDIRFVNQIDTLSSLIDQKKIVWSEMLLLESDSLIREQYDEIEKVLHQETSDTIVIYNEIVKDTTVEPVKIEPGVKKNFFQRLFQKKEIEPEIKQNAEETEDFDLFLSKPEIEDKPGLVLSPEKQQEIDKQQIQQKINRLKELDIKKQKLVREKELRLAQTGNEITIRLQRLIEQIEKDEFSKNKMKVEKADRLAESTYKWLALFTISGTILSIIVIITLFRYTHKTKAYQEALEQSKAEAEKLAKTREMFMANVSHEIRTPLNAISGFTDNLIQNTENPEISKELNIIKSASDQLLRMMNDLLDFSKLQADKLKLEFGYFSLKETFREIFNLFRYQSKEQKLMFFYHIDDEVPDVLYGDRYRLKQILINLINNAIKFTKEGQVSFTAENHRQFGKNIELKIVVKDTGIGIEKNKLSIIFEDFIQGDASFSRKFGGTGLGLSIVKKLLDLHKGKIEVDSILSKGTNITIFIPYQEGDDSKLVKEEQKEYTIPHHLIGKRALIVDDTEYNRLLLKKLLVNNSLKVEEASNGHEAIEMVKKRKYDIILMDIRMPDLDGYKVTKFIRNALKPPLSQVPVIAISAAVTDENIEKGEQSGINKFISKPFSNELLLKMIVEELGGEVEHTIIRKPEVMPVSEDKGRLNLKDLYRLSGNKNDFVIEMLEKFIDVMEKGFVEVYQQLNLQDVGQVKELAHKLAPPCRHIGALSLYEILKEIEHSSQNIDQQEIYRMVKKAEEEYLLIKQEIKSFLLRITSG